MVFLFIRSNTKRQSYFMRNYLLILKESLAYFLSLAGAFLASAFFTSAFFVVSFVLFDALASFLAACLLSVFALASCFVLCPVLANVPIARRQATDNAINFFIVFSIRLLVCFSVS